MCSSICNETTSVEQCSLSTLVQTLSLLLYSHSRYVQSIFHHSQRAWINHIADGKRITIAGKEYNIICFERIQTIRARCMALINALATKCVRVHEMNESSNKFFMLSGHEKMKMCCWQKHTDRHCQCIGGANGRCKVCCVLDVLDEEKKTVVNSEQVRLASALTASLLCRHPSCLHPPSPEHISVSAMGFIDA